MKILTACEIIAKARGDAVLVATMGAMNAFDKLDAGQPRLSSVPLMGGAPNLGLGIALARPDCKVVVVDGDASLLLQLGGLVTVAGQQPRNLVHFLIHNGTQFTGMSNLSIAGGDRVDFCGLARAAGYAHCAKYSDESALGDAIGEILRTPGPCFIELVIEPEAPTFTPINVQRDWGDLQFTRMGDEARGLGVWLRSH